MTGRTALVTLTTLVVALVVHAHLPSRAGLRDVEAASPAPRAASAPIRQLTYLKAAPGEVDNLARFIEANWFAMDAKAKAAGHLEGYELRRATPSDTAWDLLEIATYRDSAQFARIDSLFRTVYRPAHRTVLLDGKGLRELGRIVGSVTTRRVAGSVE